MKTSTRFFQRILRIAILIMFLGQLAVAGRPAAASSPIGAPVAVQSTHQPAADCVPGPHSGEITADENWCLADSPHVLEGTVTVADGVTLTIEPGVVVHSPPHPATSITIHGMLYANGVSGQPVIFTRPTSSYGWVGLIVDGGSASLTYTTVEYAGGEPYKSNIAVINGGTLNMSHSLAQECHYGGGGGEKMLYIDNSTANISDSTFTTSDEYPLYIAGADSLVTLTGNMIDGNTFDRILLGPGAMMGRDTTLTPQPVWEGYELESTFIVPPGITLTLDPGVIIRAPEWPDTSLTVQGMLNANGVSGQPVIFTRRTNSYNWAGLIVDGGSANLAYTTVEHGCRSSVSNISVINGGTLDMSYSLVHECFDTGVYVEGGTANIDHSLITGNDDRNIYATGANSTLNLSGNVIQGAYFGVILDTDSQAVLQNNVLLDNQAIGIRVNQGALATLLHTTITGSGFYGANPLPAGVYLADGGTATLTNSIIAGNGVGVRVYAGGELTLDHTLWDNETDIIGTVTDTGHIAGLAMFMDDGYHLTRYSAALEQGLPGVVPEDIDGESRPLPSGTLPDLGADEYIDTLGEDTIAELGAYPPQWIAAVDPDSGLPYSRLRQRYMLGISYGSPLPDPPDVSVQITNTLPALLDFESEDHSPAMTFNQSGQVLTWQAQPQLPVDHTAQVLIAATAENPEPGQILTNTAQVSVGAWAFDLAQSSEVPLFPPLLSKPGNGEMCTSNETGGTRVEGMSQGNAIVKVYEDNSLVITTTAEPSGFFSATYTSSRVGINAQTVLTARTCKPGDPADCSAPSQPVTLRPSQSFWCPQNSAWTVASGDWAGTYEFKDIDTGEFTSQGWTIRGPHHFPESTISLFLPDRGGVPATPYITVDGGDPIFPLDPIPTLPPFVYNFPVPMRPYDILFWNNLDPLQHDEGNRLIDPDGYIFDVNEGFDPDNPSEHAIAGVTVTCMALLPEWGGWVPWPAHLYNNQVNPQVTGPSGYFAFFTPPGKYYLQVDGINGYQSWRSPVVEVISEIVHVNVPYTPWTDGNVTRVALTSAGPQQPVVTVKVGDTVEWLAEVDGLLPPAERMTLLDEPVLRLLSDLDPLGFTLGWDGGRLAPGEIYRRQFNAPGAYTYTDGAGHTGQVIVLAPIYLPIVTVPNR